MAVYSKAIASNICTPGTGWPGPLLLTPAAMRQFLTMIQPSQSRLASRLSCHMLVVVQRCVIGCAFRRHSKPQRIAPRFLGRGPMKIDSSYSRNTVSLSGRQERNHVLAITSGVHDVTLTINTTGPFILPCIEKVRRGLNLSEVFSIPYARSEGLKNRPNRVVGLCSQWIGLLQCLASVVP